MRVGHRAALLARRRGLREVRRIVLPLRRVAEARVERVHQRLQVVEAHVAVGARVAHLLVPPDDVAGPARGVRLALEIALVVKERARRVGDHHVGVIQIFGQRVEANVVRRDRLVMRGRVVGVDMRVRRVPALARHLGPSLQGHSQVMRAAGFELHGAAREPVLDAARRFDERLPGGQLDLESPLRMEVLLGGFRGEARDRAGRRVAKTIGGRDVDARRFAQGHAQLRERPDVESHIERRLSRDRCEGSRRRARGLAHLEEHAARSPLVVVDDDGRQVEHAIGRDHERPGHARPGELAVADFAARDIGRVEQREIAHAEDEAVAQRAHLFRVRAAAHEQPRHVAESDVAFDVDFREAVAVHPEAQVFVAGERMRHRSLSRRRRNAYQRGRQQRRRRRGESQARSHFGKPGSAITSRICARCRSLCAARNSSHW